MTCGRRFEVDSVIRWVASASYALIMIALCWSAGAQVVQEAWSSTNVFKVENSHFGDAVLGPGGELYIISDVGTIKLDSDGRELWRSPLVKAGLALHPNGGLYLVGIGLAKLNSVTGKTEWETNAIFGQKIVVNSRGELVILRDSPSRTVFGVTTVSANGEKLGEAEYNEFGFPRGLDIIAGPDGDAYVLGYAEESNGARRVLLAKFSTNSVEWIVQYGPGTSQIGPIGRSLASSRNGNVTWTGFAEGQVAIPVRTYSSDGTLLWADLFSADPFLTPGSADGQSITVDSVGNVYVGGLSGILRKYGLTGAPQWTTFANGPVVNITSVPTGEIYAAAGGVSKVSASGTVLWSYSFRTGSPYKVFVDTSTRSVYVAGVHEFVFSPLPGGSRLMVFAGKLTERSDAGLPLVVGISPAQGKPVGSSTTLSVETVSATPETYQWYSQGKPIAGAANRMLVLSNLSVSNSGWYYVQVSNAVGAIFSPGIAVIVQPEIKTPVVTSTNLSFRFHTEANFSYVLQGSNDSRTWTNLTEVPGGPNESGYLEALQPNLPSRFYRINVKRK